MSDDLPADLSVRIVATDRLAALVADAKQAGRVVVTTNGVYDFLHAGHVQYLEQARSLGDMLIVLLNSDASVQRIKGPDRPINAERDRAAVLAALRCVDYVGFFETDDPCDVLGLIKPSIHAKGGDYDPDTLPEGKIVQTHGGTVKILPLKPGYSNSKQYARIRKALENDEKKPFRRPDWLAGAQKK